MDKLVLEAASTVKKGPKGIKHSLCCTVTINWNVSPSPSRLGPLTGVTGVWYDWIYEGNVAAPMLFVLLTAILLRWLKISPPLSWPCPLTGVTGVWYDRIHDGSVAPPMLFVLLTAISLRWHSAAAHMLFVSLTAILLRRLKIATPLRVCPLTGITCV